MYNVYLKKVIYIYIYMYLYVYTLRVPRSPGASSSGPIPWHKGLGGLVAQTVCMKIHNLLTNIGHRLGHQSGLDESSRRTSTVFLYGIAFHVYVVFSKIDQTHYIVINIDKDYYFQQMHVFSPEKKM